MTSSAPCPRLHVLYRTHMSAWASPSCTAGLDNVRLHSPKGVCLLCGWAGSGWGFCETCVVCAWFGVRLFCGACSVMPVTRPIESRVTGRSAGRILSRAWYQYGVQIRIGGHRTYYSWRVALVGVLYCTHRTDFSLFPNCATIGGMRRTDHGQERDDPGARRARTEARGRSRAGASSG